MNQGEDFRKFALSNTSAKGSEIDSMGKFQEKIYGEKNSLTPYILEEREMRVTQMDIFSRLMRERILWLSGPVNEQMSTVVQAQLMYLDNSGESDISMYLSTPGGSVSSGLSIVSVMEYIKCDVSTINTGMAASMGAILLGAGTKGKRFSLNYSRVMLHQVSGGAEGNINDMEITLAETKKYNDILFGLLGKYTDKDPEQVKIDATRDFWMNPQESLDYGIIDDTVKSKK